jgi:hypothetical protein
MEENIATINAINEIHPLAIAEDRGASIYRDEHEEEEDILDSKNSDLLIYPCDSRFLFSYRCWQLHQDCFWKISEHEPEFYVLPTLCSNVFYVDLRTNRYYFYP